MRTIRILQSQVGCFNWCDPSEKSLTFTIGILDTATGQWVKRGGHDCVLYVKGDADEAESLKDELEDCFEGGDLDTICSRAVKYADRVISSTDYRAQCFAFVAECIEHREELEKGTQSDRVNMQKRKVESLESKLASARAALQQAEEEAWPLPVDDMRITVTDSVKRYLDWIASNEKEMAEFKPDSPKVAELAKKCEDYRAKHSSYIGMLPAV